VRAAVADFLFNYKMSQQYPHEFSPYYLAQSAQELNDELNPRVVAFNRDIAAFSRVLQWWLEFEEQNQKKDTFISDGLITVRTISGINTIVNTTSQSWIRLRRPPPRMNC